MRFTPNDVVRVRFTEEGLRRVVAETDRINDCMRARGPKCTYRSTIPCDENREMTSQFHHVMSALGGYTGSLGGDILIEWIEPKP